MGWESLVAVVAPVVLLIVLRAILPESWKLWLRRWQGLVFPGLLLGLSVVALSLGVAFLVVVDNFGAATHDDAYGIAGLLILLGLAVAGIAVAYYRAHRAQ